MQYKAKADAIMMAMEMYARTHGFYAEHNAFMEQPSSSHLRTQLTDRVCKSSRTSMTEDSTVGYVYSCYQRLALSDFNDKYDFNQLRINMQDLQDYRFPKPKPQAYYSELLADKLRNMKRPQRVVRDISAVLYRHRPWFAREFDNNGDIHEAIYKAWGMAEPADVEQLIMEWPHVAKEGPHKIAYTRDEKYGEADRQLVLSVGKYLTRHFPALTSNTIRDISAMYCEAKFGIVRTMPEMLEIIKHGPGSCMSGDEGEFSQTDGWHPYEAYDPEHGWHMAYVKEGTQITGRALLNDETFVRTYRGNPKQSSYSDTDERLNSWLREQGYSKASSWAGFSLKRIAVSNGCGFLAPYLDGNEKDVEVSGKALHIVHEGDGEYICNETMGDAEERGGLTCDSCDDRMNEDDSYSVYRDGSGCVCSHCYENQFVTVTGRRGDTYAIRDHDAIEVNGEWYDPEYLDDNSIVQLHDGEYAHADDTVYIESCGEHYPSESERICYTQAGEYELRDDCVELENGEWCLERDAWQCEHSGDWYACDDVDSVTTKGGKIIHPDHADEYILQDDETPTGTAVPPTTLTTTN
jgi:hypothetical protein